MGDKVFVRVVPYKNVIRFDKKGKLPSRFMGLFEVLKCLCCQRLWITFITYSIVVIA